MSSTVTFGNTGRISVYFVVARMNENNLVENKKRDIPQLPSPHKHTKACAVDLLAGKPIYSLFDA